MKWIESNTLGLQSDICTTETPAPQVRKYIKILSIASHL